MRMRPFLLVALILLPAAGGFAAIPAEVFFQDPSFADPQLAPNGQLLGARTRFDHRHDGLAVVDLKTGQSNVVVKEPALSVIWFAWKTATLLVAETVSDDARYSFQTIDLAAHKATPLFRLNYEGAGRVVSLLPDDPAHMLCMWGDGALRRVDLQTGKPEEVEPPVRGISDWIVDPAGVAWAGTGYHDEKWTFIWRSDPHGPWQRRDQAGIHDATIYPLKITPDRKRLVVVDRSERDTARLAFFDLADATLTEIFQRDATDVIAVLNWGFRHEPCAALWHDSRQHLQFFLPEAETCYRGVAAALPDSDAELVCFSADNQRAIVTTRGTRDPGTFYLLDRKTGQLGLIGQARPGLEAAKLAPARTFQFQARDGLLLTGWLTAPSGVETPPLLIHVGPGLPGWEKINDYDPVAQFFASRGFATAVIHVRGTGGFGAKFRRSGDLQLTTGIVRDLEEGAAWLAAQGWIDGKRTALLGESWGGIIALHAAAHSTTFRALVNFATPMVTRYYDLEQLSPSDRDNHELIALLGNSAAAIEYLDSINPLKAAEQLRVPSFNSYPRRETANAMIESGELLERVLRKGRTNFAMFLEPAMKPETDVAKETGKRFEAAAEFLRKNL